MILTNDEELGKKINSAVFPGLQGGPLMHVIAGMYVCIMDACMCVYLYIYINIRVCIYIYVCVCVCVHASIQPCSLDCRAAPVCM